MEPKSLQEAILYFSNPTNCREYLVARRWMDGVICPRCQSKNVLFLEKYNRWHCREKHAAPQFTLKTGTIFEDSPIGLDKWLTAMWMIVNSKNGVASWEIHRALKVTQKSAWFMLHRIRLAIKEQHAGYKLGGPDTEVETDETFVGGKKQNMHKDKKVRYEAKGGASGKTVVMGILDRDLRKVRAQVGLRQLVFGAGEGRTIALQREFGDEVDVSWIGDESAHIRVYAGLELFG